MYSKYLIFIAIPCNLFLWGCEIWSLRQTLLDYLEVFLHQSARRILRIQVRHVIDHRINNEHVREFFLTYRRFKTNFPFVSSITSEKISEEKVPTFPRASSQHGGTTLAKWADQYSQTSSVSSKIFNSSYLKLMTMVT